MKRGRKRKLEPLADGEGLMGELLPAAHPVELEARTTRQCSGQLLRTREPTVYAEVVNCLAAGHSVRDLMRMFGLGTHTVLAIARVEKLNVATRKALLADAMLLGAEVFAHRAIELADNCESAFEAAGTAKSLAETGNLMRGQATQIIEERVVTIDANKLAEDMAREAQALGAHGMGFERGESLALEAEGGQIAVPCMPSDNASAVLLAECSKGTLLETLAMDEALSFDGGGGGAEPPAAPSM
jgi:hypothetical protein